VRNHIHRNIGNGTKAHPKWGRTMRRRGTLLSTVELPRGKVKTYNRPLGAGKKNLMESLLKKSVFPNSVQGTRGGRKKLDQGSSGGVALSKGVIITVGVGAFTVDIIEGIVSQWGFRAQKKKGTERGFFGTRPLLSFSPRFKHRH